MTRPTTYKLIDAGLISSVVASWPGSKRPGGCLRSSVQKKDRDCGDNAQRDEDEECDPHANRNAVRARYPAWSISRCSVVCSCLNEAIVFLVLAYESAKV